MKYTKEITNFLLLKNKKIFWAILFLLTPFPLFFITNYIDSHNILWISSQERNAIINRTIQVLCVLIIPTVWLCGQTLLAYQLSKYQNGWKKYLLFVLLYPFYFWGPLIFCLRDDSEGFGIMFYSVFIAIGFPIYLIFNLFQWMIMKKLSNKKS